MEARIRVWSPSQQICEPHNLPPEPGLSGNTIRQNFRASLAGKKPRLLFSNEYGEAPLELESALLAPLLGMDRIDDARARRLSFGGSASLSLAAGEKAWSDPVDFDVTDLMPLSLSLTVGACPATVTAHPGSRTTSFLMKGDALGSPAMPDAVKTEHWYFIAALDLIPPKPSAAFIALGDSLTDGRGTTTDGDTRWTDALMERFRAEGKATGVSVINAGLGGNRLLEDGLGPSGISRYRRDALDIPGAKWLLVFEGVNDIGTLCGELGPAAVRERMTSAYREIADAARAKGVKVIGATLTPFGGSQYDTPANQEARRTLNAWIREEGAFDAVADFDAAVRDPDRPDLLIALADSGDHLHLNNEGYRRLARAIDVDSLNTR